MLVLGALGVVFGDIGTSPLYAMQVVFSLDGGIVTPTRANALGVVSTIFWSIMLVVSVKYVRFVLRAHNDGEGPAGAGTSAFRRAGRRLAWTHPRWRGDFDALRSGLLGP